MNKKRLLLGITFIVVVIIIGVFIYHQIGWKTYTNTRDGYRISAPVSYYSIINDDSEAIKYSDRSAGWVIGNPGPPGAKCHSTAESISIRIETMEQYNNGLILNEKSHLRKTADKSINIGGIQAPWYTYPNNITVGPIIHRQKAYIFEYVKPCDIPNGYAFPQHLDQFNKMLQSFEFIN